MKKLKKYHIPIFTEDYGVVVILGDRELLKKELVKFTKHSPRAIERDFKGRGVAYNLYPDSNPIIAIDGDPPVNISIATLAHESIHALNFIVEYLGIDDHDEFVAHGVASIMRTILKDLIK